MAHVLVAKLGESPAVVTAMVRALRDHPDGPGVVIDTVALLYPKNDYINRGVALIEYVLRHDGQSLEPYILDHPDVDSLEANLDFLRILNSALSLHFLFVHYI